MMRLYEVAEIMENHASRTGSYPLGKTVEEVGRVVAREGVAFFPTVDGWGRPFKLESEPWNYTVAAQNPPKDPGKTFPELKAQSPMPVFPFVGLYPGTVLEPAPLQAPETAQDPVPAQQPIQQDDSSGPQAKPEG